MTNATSADSVLAARAEEDDYARISQAKGAVEHAYALARRLVYDRLPSGPVDPARLDAGQRAALDLLDEAESELERLRQRRRERAAERV